MTPLLIYPPTLNNVTAAKADEDDLAAKIAEANADAAANAAARAARHADLKAQLAEANRKIDLQAQLEKVKLEAAKKAEEDAEEEAELKAKLDALQNELHPEIAQQKLQRASRERERWLGPVRTLGSILLLSCCWFVFCGIRLDWFLSAEDFLGRATFKWSFNRDEYPYVHRELVMEGVLFRQFILGSVSVLTYNVCKDAEWSCQTAFSSMLLLGFWTLVLWPHGR